MENSINGIFFKAHNNPKVVITIAIFKGEFTEAQLYELVCSVMELGWKFAMP